MIGWGVALLEAPPTKLVLQRPVVAEACADEIWAGAQRFHGLQQVQWPPGIGAVPWLYKVLGGFHLQSTL